MNQPQQTTSQQPSQQRLHSSATGTNSSSPAVVETLGHRRFTEFCDACRRYTYIGLCFGAPGVGKTLSARSYSRWDKFMQSSRWGAEAFETPTLDTVFYTPAVVNTPSNITTELDRFRRTLWDLARRPLRLEQATKLEAIRRRDEAHRAWRLHTHDWLESPFPELKPTYGEVAGDYGTRAAEIRDPTTLIVVDEADRLRMASLEQIRSIFDAGEVGVILIGMPGLEKRLARYPQFYSRIGFVHEFRPLGAAETRQLLEQQWTPPGVRLPARSMDPETIASIVRITNGNFRLLNRMLTQIERIIEINVLDEVTKAVVEAARESLVIGEA